MSLPLDDRWIDRLVDGELTDNERRDLLLRLDATPDGWRRCALAFLEAQSWSAACTSLATATPTEPVTVRAAARQPVLSRRRPLIQWAALAASFLLVFMLGWALRRAPVENTVAVKDNHTETPIPKAPERPQPPPVQLTSQTPVPAESDEETSLVDRVVEQWRQRGYEAERETRLISVELNDGRRVQVPIEELRVQYVGNRTY